MSNLFALLCENHNHAMLVIMKSRDVYDLKGCNRNRRGGGGVWGGGSSVGGEHSRWRTVSFIKLQYCYMNRSKSLHKQHYYHKNGFK